MSLELVLTQDCVYSMSAQNRFVSDQSHENHVTNSVAVDVNVLGALMKGGVIHNKGGGMIITIL